VLAEPLAELFSAFFADSAAEPDSHPPLHMAPMMDNTCRHRALHQPCYYPF